MWPKQVRQVRVQARQRTCQPGDGLLIYWAAREAATGFRRDWIVERKLSELTVVKRVGRCCKHGFDPRQPERIQWRAHIADPLSILLVSKSRRHSRRYSGCGRAMVPRRAATCGPEVKHRVRIVSETASEK